MTQARSRKLANSVTGRAVGRVNLGLPGIPWSHSATGMGSAWRWETPHFIVTITGDHHSCYWVLTDKTSGSERILADGRAANFQDGEKQVRESIGKSYPPSFGYAKYAGPLASTFMISTGESIDFTPYLGEWVNVEAYGEGGQTVTLQGLASVKHYDFVVTDKGQAYHITPAYIVSVSTRKRSSLNDAPATKLNSRTVPGTVTPGCTGRAGFMPNTVEHPFGFCPIHER